MMNEKEIDALIPGFELEGNPDICLFMIHGFTGSAPELYPLAKLINDGGISIKAIGLPGHGTSSLEALKAVGPKDWLDAVNKGYDEACAKYKKVFAFGYSMGGVLAINLTKNHTLPGLILCEPAVTVNNNFTWLAKLLRHTNLKFEWSDSKWEFPDHSEKFWRGQKGYYVKSVADLLTVSKLARKQIPSITCPIMATWATNDQAVRKSGIDMALNKSKSEMKVYKEYVGNTHHLPSEPEKEQLAKDILEFINKATSIN